MSHERSTTPRLDDSSSMERETFLELLRSLMDSEPGEDLEDPTKTANDLRVALTSFRLHYKFGMDELLTKITILREEFEETHEYSPIEHVKTRLKSMDSLLQKVQRIGCPTNLESIRANIRDIAGIRITCAFESDAYWVADMLTNQPDVSVIETKDYIAHPKDNGYQSLHLIVGIPVYLSDRTEVVPVEIQIRTIAMDFWASVEHKIYYKYDREVPAELLQELRDAARAADQLDQQMARLRDEIGALSGSTQTTPPARTSPQGPRQIAV